MKTLKNPSYTYRKGSVYYFSKVVPQDLADFYAKPRIVKSLRTKSRLFFQASKCLVKSGKSTSSRVIVFVKNQNNKTLMNKLLLLILLVVFQPSLR